MVKLPLVRSLDKPTMELIVVSMDRMVEYSDLLSDISWLVRKKDQTLRKGK